MNILLTIAYDGTEYCGWQFQENAVSVQEKVESALAEVLGRPIRVTGASRTDAGVHALEQRAAFRTDEMKIPVERFAQVVNRYLPGDIVLQNAEFVCDEFHPRFSAKEKTYIYKIQNTKFANPILSRYAWHVAHELDVAAMAQAAGEFVGTFDFAAFCATGGSEKSTIRSIYECRVEQGSPETIDIIVRGNAFLYNMVRIMAGTLMYAGAKKIMPGEISGIIEKRDRTLAGKTAPPHGLCLAKICY